MVARYVKEGNVQQGNEIFKIGIGQVAAAEDDFNIFEMSVCAKVVQAFDNFVADGEDFHKRIVP